MTRYEMLEAWLTPKEWAKWKKEYVRYRRVSGRSISEATRVRENYLNTPRYEYEFDIDLTRAMFFDMINDFYWAGTRQGRSFWARIANRQKPIRTL